jgi:predicted nuclease with TOPRIM domain
VGKGKPKAKFREEKDGEVQKLKDTIRRLKSDNTKLKSELKTYEAAFQKNIQFLKGKVKDVPLKDLLEAAKKEQTLKQLEDTKELTFKQMEEKWKCFQCGIGVMKITVITRQDGKHYFRRCTAEKCGHRTELKPFTDDVEIS